jgi:hypothetical protein
MGIAIFPRCCALVLLPSLAMLIAGGRGPETELPAFGKDTVLVYKSSIETDAGFVVRIAEFVPNRFVEWEDKTTQGTIFMTAKAVEDGREFVNWRLYEGGVDTRGKNATTLWLSRRIFRELKEKQRIKVNMDGLPTWFTLLGSDHFPIEVNRASYPVPVIKTRDERGAERWFIDLEDNPLLVNFLHRNYQQKLVSITTDRPNTLRWIKNNKKR